MLNIIGYVGAVLTTIASLPQLIKVFKSKSAEDISFYMLLLFIAGNLAWVTYGILLGSVPIWLSNLIMGTMLITILILKIYYKNNQLSTLK